MSHAIPTLADMPAHHPHTERGALSITETADWLGVHRSTIYRMIERNEFPPARRVGSQYRVSVAALRAWLGDTDA